MKKLLRNLKKEIYNHPVIYFLLTIILIGAAFVRIYRTGQVLGFYFDQGRDALVVWDFLYKGKFFLIGPTTGIAGIFRGPFYYWLITPFYWLGNGNPVFPAVFLALTSVLAIGVAYYLGKFLQSRVAGIFVTLLAGFSFFMMVAGRWLSNPTPMLLLSVLLLLSTVKIVRWTPVRNASRKPVGWWFVISFLAGISLFHFGSSGEFFYFPALFVFALWQRKNLPNVKGILVCIGIFLLTAAPLVVFDIRHEFLLTQNIKKLFVDDQSFKASFWEVFNIRINFYYSVFVSKLFPTSRMPFFLWGIVVAFFVTLPNLIKNKYTRLLLLILISPAIGLLFFQGNFGNIYDYYLTGYYMLFLLLLAIVFGKIWKFLPGKLFVLAFFYFFLTQNLEVTKARITDEIDGPETIALGNQKKTMDWIYRDVSDENSKFNIDVYVPPVIPYAYDYLFRWYGGRVNGEEPSQNQEELLYTIYEIDPPHPERLQAWLDRQKGVGVIEKEETFGGITVQKRHRI